MAARKRIRRKIRRKAPAMRGAQSREPAPAARGSATGDLMVGGVMDPAEKAADRMADRALSGRAPAISPLVSAGTAAVHRQCAECSKEEKEGTPLKRAAAAAPMVASGAAPAAAPKAAASAVGALGSGRRMSPGERSYFEPRFGCDFSQVRIHEGPAAAQAAHGLGARAFAKGSDIAFAPGERTPRTMAHELAHVVQDDGALRRKCGTTPADCSNEEIKTLTTSLTLPTKKYPQGFAYKKANKGCYVISDMAKAIKPAQADLYEGLTANYAAEVQSVNKVDPTKIRDGQCLVFPIGWKDPKIGDSDAELKAMTTDETNKMIGAIYGEQSRENDGEVTAARNAFDAEFIKQETVDIKADNTKLAPLSGELTRALAERANLNKQRAYILWAILSRIKSYKVNFGATMASVLTPGAFHALDPKNESYKNNLIPAIEYLEGKSPSKPINTGVIDQIKAQVTAAKGATIPIDAGPFYFHWNTDSTAEAEYSAAKRAGKSEAEAEKIGAYKNAKRIWKGDVSVTAAEGWATKIPGVNTGGANERIGSMYIFK